MRNLSLAEKQKIYEAHRIWRARNKLGLPSPDDLWKIGAFISGEYSRQGGLLLRIVRAEVLPGFSEDGGLTFSGTTPEERRILEKLFVDIDKDYSRSMERTE